MNKIEFFIPCNPPKATSQQKGVMVIGGHPRFFKKKHVKDAENDLTSMLMPHRPQTALVGPVSCVVTWVYPYRKSEKKKNIGKMIPCDTRPDCSNLVKMLEDCMTRLGFWNDDSQVYSLNFSKHWGQHPGIGIVIEEFPAKRSEPSPNLLVQKTGAGGGKL